MDPTRTLEGLTTQIVADLYFTSLNDKNMKVHIVTEKHAPASEIEADVKLWYGGFLSCAKLLSPGVQGGNLPTLQAIQQLVTRTFTERAQIAA